MPEQAPQIVITGAGMVSSLGLGAIASCAAARAGLSRPGRVPGISVPAADGGELVPVVGHAVAELTQGFSGLGRLIRLGLGALTDLIESGPPPNDQRTGIIVNASTGYCLTAMQRSARAVEASEEVEEDSEADNDDLDEMVARNEHYAKHLIPRMTRLAGLRVAPSATMTTFRDHTGMSDAWKTAREWMASGLVDRCIVGGIESRLEPQFIEAFDHFGLLKKPDVQTGLIPGEAAAFLLLEPMDRAGEREASIGAVLSEPALESEAFDRLSTEPIVGAALGRAIERALVSALPASRSAGLTLAGLNGDEYGARDWGHALARLSKDHPALGRVTWCPAQSFGEIGAASSAVAACMGARALARGYAPSKRVLVWTASEKGEREAFCLDRFDG